MHCAGTSLTNQKAEMRRRRWFACKGPGDLSTSLSTVSISSLFHASVPASLSAPLVGVVPSSNNDDLGQSHHITSSPHQNVLFLLHQRALPIWQRLDCQFRPLRPLPHCPTSLALPIIIRQRLVRMAVVPDRTGHHGHLLAGLSWMTIRCWLGYSQRGCGLREKGK